MKCKEVLKLLKITRQTLNKYKKEGRIKTTQLPNGYFEYDKNDVYKILNKNIERYNVLYCRVSSSSQKQDLIDQRETLEQFCKHNSIIIKDIYSEIGSGINFDRKEFQRLLNDVMEYKIDKIFITYKDRLSRISFDLFRDIFEKYNTEIIILNEIDNPKEIEKEILEEIISILHCFSMKMYSSRRKNKLELIEKELELEQEVKI